MDPDRLDAAPVERGLCASCRHARIVRSRTARYTLCGLSAEDPAYPRYPRLPVTTCSGHAPGDPGRV
jgi:hypothetical protein